MLHQKGKYFKEFRELTKKAQLENRGRALKVLKKKREKILQIHQAFSEKNAKVKELTDLFQSHMRAKSVMNTVEKDETNKLLMRLKMKDPFKQSQRASLEKSIKILNEEMGIGSNLFNKLERCSTIG